MYSKQQFEERYWQGIETEARVATQLRRLGFDVYLPKPDVRDDDEHWASRQQTDDMYVRNAATPEWLRIEVKGKNERFTTPEDFPFPTATIMTQRTWDAKHDKPRGVLIHSNETGATLIAPTTATFIAQQADPARNHAYPVIRCNRGSLRPLTLRNIMRLQHTTGRPA